MNGSLILCRCALLLGIVVLGCNGGDDPLEPDPDHPPLEIEVTGRLERGAEVTLSLRSATGVGEVTWSAEPAGSAELLAGGRARLLEAGKVTFRAQASERSGELAVDVAVPPTIVFDMLRDGNRDIYKAALDGRDLDRLTTHVGDDRAPTAAGGTVVFVSYRSGAAQLHSVPLAGGTVTQLTSSSGAKSSPALSRDGSRLAFTNSVSGVPKFWTASANGSGAARAAPSFGYGGAIDASPNWSPTGDRVVFVSTTLGTSDLFIFTPSTAQVDTLLAESTPEVEPAWSPDGKWIAFASQRDGQTDLYMINVTTRELRQLTDRAETDASPAWLADGRIVYLAWVDQVPRLRWLDPSNPAEVHDIPVGSGTVSRVATVW